MNTQSRPSENASLGYTAASLLYRLVQEYTPSQEEGPGIRLLQAWALNKGLKTWRDEIGNLYLSPPKTRQYKILLASHIDTVPGRLPTGFNGEKVWGRGAVDAKGPLSAMATALLAIAREHPEAPVAVAALVGEEDDSRGARYLASTGLVPPLVIIGEPSGGSRVIIGYRGSLKILLECTGRGGHASTPEIGDSALDKLLDTISRIRAYYKPGSGKASIALTRLEAGNSWNTLPVKAIAWLDIRVEDRESRENMQGIIEKALAPTRETCTYRIIEETPPIRVKLNDPVPRGIIRALLKVKGSRGVAVKRGTSDMNILGPYAKSIAAYGPGDPGMAHTLYEEVSVEELEVGVKVYVEAVHWLTSLNGFKETRLPTS